MKKSTKKQDRVIKKCMALLTKMVKIAKEYRDLSVGDRYRIHHMLLDVIPKTEFVLNANNFEYTDEVTATIKDVAEHIIPRADCYQ